MIANQSLRAFNTLAIDVSADWFAAPASLPELKNLLAQAAERQLAISVLGEGSNILFTADVPGLVLKPALMGMQLSADEGATCLVEVAEGEHFDDLVSWSLDQGLQGLENLSLIPGSVGAAPFQNIGAYGVELADRLLWLEAVSLATGDSKRFSRDDCGFAYRDSIFKSQEAGRWLITRLCLRLQKQENSALELGYADLQQRFDELPCERQNARGLRGIICDLRRAKLPDPAELPNAGSFFKNPWVTAAKAKSLKQRFASMPQYPLADGGVKLAAGWLIEQAGFKGKSVGAVGMHQQQALVLVNHGGASAADIVAFAEQVKAAVQQRFGVLLEQEPVCLPSLCGGEL